MKYSVFDGQFYEGSFERLDKQIKDCFIDKFGPSLPLQKRTKNIKAVIAPHAGYMFSGPCQAWAYKEIAESKLPDVFVILGTNHTGLGARFSTLLDDFETPFGIIKVDKQFGKELMKKFKLLKNDEKAYSSEHSIEVQLPFLQFVNKDELTKVRILPILIQDVSFDLLKELGEAIGKIKDKKIIIIASSDFTHYGYNYGYLPFTENKKENMYELDNKAIDFIKKLDSEGFLNYKKEKMATICGYNAIIALIEACKSLKVKNGKLLKYYTSGDISKDYNNMVGYAAMVFE